MSQSPKRGHLHSDSSFFTSSGLGGRGSDLLLVLRLVLKGDVPPDWTSAGFTTALTGKPILE